MAKGNSSQKKEKKKPSAKKKANVKTSPMGVSQEPVVVGKKVKKED